MLDLMTMLKGKVVIVLIGRTRRTRRCRKSPAEIVGGLILSNSAQRTARRIIE